MSQEQPIQECHIYMDLCVHLKLLCTHHDRALREKCPLFEKHPAILVLLYPYDVNPGLHPTILKAHRIIAFVNIIRQKVQGVQF